MDDLAFNIGEAEVAALVFEGELFVIDSEEMENCRVEVVHVHGIARDGIAEGIGFAMHAASFHTAAG